MNAPEAFLIQSRKLARRSDRTRRQIALFDIDICEIEITGCELIRTASNDLTSRGANGCTFAASAIYYAVKEAALRAYIALGGDDLPNWVKPKLAPSALETNFGDCQIQREEAEAT